MLWRVYYDVCSYTLLCRGVEWTEHSSRALAAPDGLISLVPSSQCDLATERRSCIGVRSSSVSHLATCAIACCHIGADKSPDRESDSTPDREGVQLAGSDTHTRIPTSTAGSIDYRSHCRGHSTVLLISKHSGLSSHIK